MVGVIMSSCWFWWVVVDPGSFRAPETFSRKGFCWFLVRSCCVLVGSDGFWWVLVRNDNWQVPFLRHYLFYSIAMLRQSG
jgi:hypothetical protein